MKTLEDILARHPFWNNLPPQYFPLLIECAVIERFRPGEQIFKKGYDAEHFYLIHHGKVALQTAYVPGEGLITIQTLGVGEALGWSWLFPPHQWHFSARAIEPTEAVVFKADALRNKAKETPAFGYDLALRVGGIMLQRVRNPREYGSWISVTCHNDNDAQSPHEGAKELEALARGSGEPNWTKESSIQRGVL